MRRPALAVALVVLVAMATYADRTTLMKPTGEAVTLGGVLSELMGASFACEPLEVDSWSGWRCSMETVTVSIEGSAAGVWTLGLQSPDLSSGSSRRSDRDAVREPVSVRPSVERPGCGDRHRGWSA